MRAASTAIELASIVAEPCALAGRVDGRLNFLRSGQRGRVRRVLHLGFGQHDAARVDRQRQEGEQHGQQEGRQNDDHAAAIAPAPRRLLGDL